LNDPLNITGYSQVLKQTKIDLETGEQANITYIIGRNRISQITIKDNTEQELYFTFDGHGSTRVLTDLAGAIVELYAFDAYGNAIGFDPSIALTEFLYSGEQFDSKIGQQYLRARYYDPATGRFNRLDPFFGNLIDPQSFHKYAYVHGDPINMNDLLGLEANPLVGVGMMAHRLISDLYKMENPLAYLIEKITIGKGIPGTHGKIKPDIMNYYNSEIGEIKPAKKPWFIKGPYQAKSAVDIANGIPTMYKKTLITIPALPNYEDKLASLETYAMGPWY
jgi:RHS repeat-associated protein